MIKIENTIHPSDAQWERIIVGTRNPLNSWNKSDSCWENSSFVVGNNDIGLMTRLARAGKDHRKFMRMINVYCDITAPLYWWKEYDTYKVGTVANSCSTMHKIQDKEFSRDDFSLEHVAGKSEDTVIDLLIDILNNNRNKFLVTKDKSYWWNLIQLLPSSYNQRRTVELNYEVLSNIYFARRNHKLDEWHTFCQWIEELPHMKIFLEAIEDVQ